MTKNDKIIIWGVGREFYQKAKRVLENYNVVALTDNRVMQDVYGIKVVLPSEIMKISFDKLVITPTAYFDEIKKQALDLGVEEDKIILGFEGVNEAKFLSDMQEYSEKLKHSEFKEFQKNFTIKEENISAYKDEWWQQAGDLYRGYFWQDLWGGQRIVASGVKEVLDIGSRLDGFIAHLLTAGLDVTMLDIRPLNVEVPNLKFVCTDATSLENIEDGSVECLSALCSLEHFGLGRYNDPVDPDACFKVFKAIQRVMMKGGRVYISVPTSTNERVCFNNLRFFHPQTIVNVFDEMQLIELTGVYLRNKENVLKTFSTAEEFEDETNWCCYIFEKM